MGYAKQQGMICDGRGHNTDQSFVCSYCIKNKHLSNFVYCNRTKIKCDFCGKIANCVTIEDLCGKIMKAIALEYEDANECMGWEGELVGAATWDTETLLRDLNEDMELTDNVLNTVIDNIHDITWCETNPYNLRRNKEQHYMWQSFCEMVKYSARYVFFRMPERCNHDLEESPYLILDHIAKAADKLELFRTIKKGDHFHRGRVHNKDESISKPSQLSSPPNNQANANRMSAEGISVFYGADSDETVLNEISTDSLCFATVARFRSLRDFNILDLTKIHQLEYPSLFDDELGQYREEISFFQSLEEDLIKPIKGEAKKSTIEYVPTQVVAEYFRFLHKIHGNPVDGIAYRSAENDKGICYVFFVDQNQCLPDQGAHVTQKLQMVKRSIRHYKLCGSWKKFNFYTLFSML